MHDLTITGGTVVDGTGDARYRADIGVKDGQADVNVIDMEALNLEGAADGLRVRGYDATVVNGVITRRHEVDTGARPGKLLRGVR